MCGWHVGRPGGGGERPGVSSRAPGESFVLFGICYHGSFSAAQRVRTCILTSNPVNLDVLIHLFLQQMLAKYYLPGSSWLVGEMETKLIQQEMYYYEYS